jgi:hypothetical protein
LMNLSCSFASPSSPVLLYSWETANYEAIEKEGSMILLF